LLIVMPDVKRLDRLAGHRRRPMREPFEEKRVSREAVQRQELAHIERMIVELKRTQGARRGVGAHNPVMHPEYWRQRIQVLMRSPDVTDPMIQHALALLERLEDVSNGHEHSDQSVR
jgi:hypothetical protein